MNFKFREAIKGDGDVIATWKYEGEYSFYNNDKTESKHNWALNIHEDEDALIIENENGEIVGNCSFSYDDEDKEWVFGVQIRPDLTGKGNGTESIKAILDFGQQKYGFKELVLLVAKFNQRAIKIYDRLGFKEIEEFMWHVNDEDKEFLVMKKCY